MLQVSYNFGIRSLVVWLWLIWEYNLLFLFKQLPDPNDVEFDDVWFGLFGFSFWQAGCKIYLKKRKADWLSSLLQSKFFGSCVHHQNNRKNEKNVFCIDCGIAICRHCLISHCIHRRLQICKYVYQYVVRVPDLQNHLDCCNIQVFLCYLLKLYKLLVLKLSLSC